MKHANSFDELQVLKTMFITKEASKIFGFLINFNYKSFEIQLVLQTSGYK